jgi:hypothetical protein
MTSVLQERANKQLLEICEDKKILKSKFKTIIKTINANLEISRLITPDMSTHLKALIELWNNDKDANMDYYWKFKEHHPHITGQIEHAMFVKLWDEYIQDGMSLRCKLTSWNHKLHQIHNSSPYREQQRRQDDGVRVVFAKN